MGAWVWGILASRLYPVPGETRVPGISGLRVHSGPACPVPPPLTGSPRDSSGRICSSGHRRLGAGSGPVPGISGPRVPLGPCPRPHQSIRSTRPPHHTGIFRGRSALPLSCSVLRNGASGPEIGLSGRILAGLLPGKHQNRWLPGSSPAKSRPGRPHSGPEALLHKIE